MKRNLLRTFMVGATNVIGLFGILVMSAQESFPPTFELKKPDRIRTLLDSGPMFSATALYPPFKIDPKQPSDKPASRNDRERVEVLARHITFPEVLNQGALMLGVEYPNAMILCLDAALYAGRVEGLILAMDRDTVLEQRLQWTIDTAGDLFNSCLEIFLMEAFAGQNVNDRNQLKDVKEEIAEQIQMIQKALRYAGTVRVKPAACFEGEDSHKAATWSLEERLLPKQPETKQVVTAQSEAGPTRISPTRHQVK